jgi:hypothetical protein
MTMTKMPRFDKHPCPGDSIVWRNGGFTLVARIKFDDATNQGNSTVTLRRILNAGRMTNGVMLESLLQLNIRGGC